MNAAAIGPSRGERTGLALSGTALSDPAGRAHNEDRAWASRRMLAVADGVGGAAAGEAAAELAILAVISLDKRRPAAGLERELDDTFEWANGAVELVAWAEPEKAGMATTLCCAALGDDGRCVVANVGDSRAYLLRSRRLSQITEDESLVGELVRSGRIDAEQARRHPQRSVVMRALDGVAARPPRTRSFGARAGDRLLVCSDGLSDYVTDPEIRAALAPGAPAEAACRLVRTAIAAGTRDNVSVAVADVSTAPTAPWTSAA